MNYLFSYCQFWAKEKRPKGVCTKKLNIAMEIKNSGIEFGVRNNENVF